VSAEVQSKITSILFQLQALHEKLRTATQARQGIGPALGREAIGELGGALAEAVIGSAKAGDVGYSIAKKMAKQSQTQQIAAQESALAQEFRQIVEGAIPLLSQVSVDSQSLRSSGNSQILVRRLKRIAGFANIETKILRAIQFVRSLQDEKLIMNSDIPEALVARKSGELEAYDLLRHLEEALRKFIETSLSRLSPDWWTTRVPEDVRISAEQRKAKDDRPWTSATGANLHPIHYVDFPDYVKIIRRKDNWREVFARVFHDQEIISTKLRELEPVRNALAHSRSLSKNGLNRLRINAKDILALLPA
jgi:hypothetical protein